MNTNEGLRKDIGDDIEKALEDSRVEGKTLGKYRIGSEIGKGGMGAVYLAKDVSLGRMVVVKVVRFPSREAEHCKMMAARFRREAQAACRVLHPNVAVTFAFDEIDGRHLLVMEWIDGRTLREELRKDDDRPRAMPVRKAVKIVIEILKGLEAIHAAKIVHRDMKPGNVMLTHKDDQVKILDFGLGKAAESSGDIALDMTLTQQGIPVGSPLYMSPEQTRSLPVNGTTDIYSVGVMLFQLLTGKLPFIGKDAFGIYAQHQSAPVPPIVLPGGAKLPQGLDAVVRKAMAKAPGERYQTAAAMRAALEAIDFDAKPAPAVVAVRPRSGSPLRPIAAFAAFVLLAAGAVLAMDAVPTDRAPARSAQAAPAAPDAAVPSDEDAKPSEGIAIPAPPPAATVAQGCKLYEDGRTTDAIATLTRALEAKPDDAQGLFCLCGAYVRQPETRREAQKTCKAYRAHPGRGADKANQVDMWLHRLR